MSRTASIGKWSGVTVVAATVTVFAVELIAGPIFSLSTKTWPPEVQGDKVIASIEGAVKEADRVSGTLRVASGFLGLSSLPLVVTPETEVAVHGKLGGVDDLDRGQVVRVTYEVFPDRLLAWRIDVLDRAGSSDLVAPPVSTRNPSAVEAAPSAVEAAPPPPETVSKDLPARRSKPPVVRAPAPKPLPSAPASAGPPARSAPPGSADDGADAVDWLFKGASAR